MGRKKVLIIVSTVLVLGVALFAGVQYVSGRNAGSEKRPVMEAIVGRDTIITKVTSKGEVSLLNTQLIYANLVAEVEEVLVEKNDTVSAGQPIIQYKEKSREDLERSIEKAKLDVQGAELALNSAKIPPSVSSVERAKVDMDNARKVVERAKNDVDDMDKDIARQEEKVNDYKKELANNETLLLAGAISQKTVDDARKVLRDMEEALDTLKKSRSYKAQEIGTSEEAYRYSELVYGDIVNKLSEQSVQNNIKQQEISLQRARLALTQLERELEDFQLEILSPISGTVTKVNVSRGEITPTDKALMEIADITDYIIKADVNERNSGKIEIGQDVKLTGAVLGEDTVTGKVTKIGYIAETKQNNNGTERVIPVEITVDRDSRVNVLKPGISLDATIITSVKEDTIAIPILSTLSESDGSSFVYIIKDDDTLEKRPVKLGAYADMSVEVEGVVEGERIVAQPSVDMSDGMAVMVTNREAEEQQSGGEEL